MIILESEKLDAGALQAQFEERLAPVGAITSFIGKVRPEGDRQVEALMLDCHQPLAHAQIGAAVQRAQDRWALEDVLIAHRVGTVPVGEAVVLVVCASAHRRDAFEACDFLMDYLKTDAPFWKKEIAPGEARWIEPRAQDYTDRERWES